MNVLVTAGNTRTMIDRVRCITNIFTGRTGANVAAEAARRGHAVTLLTSHPEVLPPTPGLTVLSYQTFDELALLMAQGIRSGSFDAVIHSAAVSDYHVAGVYATPALEYGTPPPPDSLRDPATPPQRGGAGVVGLHALAVEAEHPPLPAGEGSRGGNEVPPAGVGHHPSLPPVLTEVSAGKVKSSHPEVWLRLTPAPKLVDKVRTEWHFRGVLVKFKLEVGVSEDELREIAERSRLHSHADLMSANTLDGAAEWALVGAGEYTKVPRANLAAEIVTRVELLSLTSR